MGNLSESPSTWRTAYLCAVAAIALAAVLTGCETKPGPGAPSVETPSPAATSSPLKADWDSQPSGKEWTQFLVTALEDLGPKLLSGPAPTDATKFCPGYALLTAAQRKQFYVTLISSMARFESSFKTGSTYKESFEDSAGAAVISRGLLQISIESANQKAYKCDIKTTADLHDAETNLECTVRIQNFWAGKGGTLFGWGRATAGTCASYWSVCRELRFDKKTEAWKPRDSFKAVLANVRALPFCK